MMVISILTRRLREGKTYQDFRRAWYHTVGYGAPVRLYSAINAFDPREIIVVALGEFGPEQDPMELIHLEVKQRLDKPLDAVIEPEIGRKFGIVVSEDDFSPKGKMRFRAASVNGKETDFREVARALDTAKDLLTLAAKERDTARNSLPPGARRRSRSG